MSTSYYLVSKIHRCYVFIADSNGNGLWPPSWSEFYVKAVSGPESDGNIFLIDEHELAEDFLDYEEVFVTPGERTTTPLQPTEGA